MSRRPRRSSSKYPLPSLRNLPAEADATYVLSVGHRHWSALPDLQGSLAPVLVFTDTAVDLLVISYQVIALREPPAPHPPENHHSPPHQRKLELTYPTSASGLDGIAHPRP